MRIIFRTDSSSQIGSGHLMRCLALAEGFKAAGASVVFICRELPGDFSHHIEKRRFDLIRLPAPLGKVASTTGPAHAHWLGVPWEQDAAETLAALAPLGADVLVVDHYSLDWRWEVRVAGAAGKVVVLDDLADRRHECDILIDSNYSSRSNRYSDLVPARTEQLLGPKFALLRAEFGELRTAMAGRPRPDRIRKVVSYFGAADATASILKVVDALKDLTDYQVTLVYSDADPSFLELSERLAKYPHFSRAQPSERFGELMAASDLFIGAGGTTTWERSCLGVPSITLATASNQVPASADLGRDGFCVYLGEAKNVTVDQVRAAVLTCDSALGFASFLGRRSGELVDGAGVRRVVKRIMTDSLVLREARIEELGEVYAWRNHIETRKWFFHADPVDFETHSRWYQGALESDLIDLLIAEREGIPVGVVRFDHEREESRISVYLVPGFHGQGLGSSLIRAAVNWLQRNRSDVRRVRAEVLRGNQASERAFLTAGFGVEYLTLTRNVAPMTARDNR